MRVARINAEPVREALALNARNSTLPIWLGVRSLGLARMTTNVDGRRRRVGARLVQSIGPKSLRSIIPPSMSRRPGNVKRVANMVGVGKNGVLLAAPIGHHPVLSLSNTSMFRRPG